MTLEKLALMVDGKKEKQLAKILLPLGFTDCTIEQGYTDFKRKEADGSMLRVYWSIAEKRPIVQRLTPCKMVYSGTPIFEPGGCRTI